MILLIEDNPNDVALTLRAFKKQNINCEIIVASDGAEALEFLFCTGAYAGRDAGKMPHLLLLDLKLPKVDGLEVIKKVRNYPTTRFLPIVVLTTSLEEKDIAASYHLGVNSYIRKPVDFDTFNQVVGCLSYYWLELNKQPEQP